MTTSYDVLNRPSVIKGKLRWMAERGRPPLCDAGPAQIDPKATLELFDIGHSFDQSVKRVWNRRILAAGGTKRHRTSLCL
ncbi:hypothetical protein [Burkholderia cepacia]|uniref:hypothetical protein n=1 Tax=Burkholderia cepacia TaxID=292 RepID=UPI000AFEF988|nr:hypothetical protein [Burkholderia cepacia]